MVHSTEQDLVIEQRLANDQKSPVVAYLLWFFFGVLGAHRFYVGRKKSAFAILLLFALGWATLAVTVGMPLLVIAAAWVLLDAFLIPGWITAHSEAVRAAITADVETWDRSDKRPCGQATPGRIRRQR